MAESTTADLPTSIHGAQSSRAKWDVLFGEDTALAMIQAASSGDDTALRSMLSQPHWTKIAFAQQLSIYSFSNPSLHDTSDGPKRDARTMSNRERASTIAAENGHAAAISALLRFVKKQHVKPLDFITRWAVKSTITNGHAAVIEAMVSAVPKVGTSNLGHDGQPLDFAVCHRKTEVVAVLLQLGVDPVHAVLKFQSYSQMPDNRYGPYLLTSATRAE